MKEISLSNGGAALVDDEDFALVSQYRWIRGGRNKRYVIHVPAGGKWLMMARLVSGAERGQSVAWRDGNTLNCQKSNLFVGTPGEARNISRGGNGVIEKSRAAKRKAERPAELRARRIERFLEKVDVRGPDECWNWMGATMPSGYGHCNWYSKAEAKKADEYTHRVAWVIANKRQIPPGAVIRHTCDNSRCCNPAHLQLGTQLQNIQDRTERKRHRVAPNRGIGPRIVELRNGGATWGQIAQALDCSISAISYHLSRAGMTKKHNGPQFAERIEAQL